MTIGIKSIDDFKEYTMAIARGEHKPAHNEPKIWFDSIESMAQVLSTKNRELLRIIRDEKPQSLAELAKSTGRQRSNLSRTLRKMEQYGIVALTKEAKTIKPSVVVDNFEARFGV
jgi:predicted transcriptional regulator